MFDSDVFELSKEQELTLEKNLVWLFGSPRGGTTWVASQLLSYQTIIINEPHIDEHLAMRAGEFLDKFVRRIDNPQKNSEYFFSEKYKQVWKYYLKKLIIHRFYAQTNDLTHKTIVKEVAHFGSADILLDCLSNSKAIILLRDGRDVIDSLVDARSKEGWMTKSGLKPITKVKENTNEESFLPTPNRRVFVKNQSKAWVVRTENFLKAYNNTPTDLRYLVKYEELLKNTKNELKKIYEFIKIDILDSDLQKMVEKFNFKNIPEDKKGSGKFTRSATPGKWRENFDQDEKKIMNQIMGKTLQKLDYELD